MTKLITIDYDTVQFNTAYALAAEEVQKYGEPRMHRGIGMHRVCELQLVARMADIIRPALYLELGCGNGYLMSLIQELSPKTRLVGYEHLSEPIRPGIEIRQMDIFSQATLEELTLLFSEYQDSRIFVYTDNGNKFRELQMVAPLLKPGDVLATHDWPNEVIPGGGEQFLLDSGFEVINELLPYIRDFASLQRFWIKR
jgi:predicted O-methyltransferase YrrM